MAANLIGSRIADFLKKYPPFSYLEENMLSQLSEQAIVRYFGPGDFVFQQGEEKSGYLYVIREGLVHLERLEAGVAVLVDTCDEGDLFGVRAMLSGKPYVFQARCEEESLVYGIPIALFQSMLEGNGKIAMFFAAGLAGGQAVLLKKKTNPLPVQDPGALLNWNRAVDKPSRSLVWAYTTETIRSIALKMETERVGSVILCDASDQAIGIVTDTDFRKKVGTGKVDITSPVNEIMSAGLIKMPLGQPLSRYLLEMLRHKIRHICLEEEGRPVGMLSERDLMAAHQNHPMALIYALERAPSVNDLVRLRGDADVLVKFYLEQHVSVRLTSSLITHINDTLINKAITLALQELVPALGSPPVDFSWISLGSEGRSEQLIRTDQDNAIVFEDVAENKLSEVKDYFLQLAARVNQILEDTGFERCPADMMAGNEEWCQPLSAWKKYFTGWISQPQEKSLMLSTIFFDYRKVYGSSDLIGELKTHLAKEINSERIFLNFLASNALKNPAPLTFFKNFMVERSGEHQDEFDIKARAMMPLVDIARVLALDVGLLDEMNTVKRYLALAEKEPKRSELYTQAAESYEYLMQIRALNGFKHQDSGRFITISALSKLERQILRNTFEPINQLQKMLSLRYQLGYFQ
ncbi:cyclic nucleotide-binding domain-containing protein [Fulvivirga sp. M361]|uniref:DUF294 nucleotidyltransferase-like domain-containing protein n=1 Tax=Fulvivirga sp. M361 TaxID=2594266 RepID=UPI001179F978|nr:DUF294 nucleotidyltransferase-like domain-containing protein [Fulvivirga sp. M361]TRX50881.1 cyclic nucleotide-binding domain-containing protein [Fulvivirga sp. M361]